MIDTGPFRKAMHDIGAARGDFTLFALCMRTNGLGAWDLVVAAPWLEAGTHKAISEVVDLVTKSIGRKPFQQLARVAVVSPEDPTIKFLARHPLENGERRIDTTGEDMFGLQIQTAIILRAKLPDPKERDRQRLTSAGSRARR